MFEGEKYRLCNNWYDILPVDEFNNRAIKYLEIGSFYGANIISVAENYGSHYESELFCIDPYVDYNEYSEYKGKQENIYTSFLKNIEPYKNIKHIRGFSHKEIPKFEDDFFDLIYIDGNHEPDFVLEDAVLSFRKLRPGCILIFDDFGWGGPYLTTRGIMGFLDSYNKKIQYLGYNETQVFIKKNN